MVLRPLAAAAAAQESTSASGIVTSPPPTRPAETDTDAEKVLVSILGTGQSLSQGSSAPLDDGPTPPAPHAWKLVDASDRYALSAPDAPTLSLAPLTEPFRRGIETEWEVYPGNIAGKTPHSSMAAQLSLLCAQGGHAPVATVHSVVGKSGAPMWEITREGTRNPYAASLFEVQACRGLAAARGQRLHVGAVVLTHGEADALIGHTTYADEVCKLRRYYAEDVRRLTGQEAEPLLILSQQHSFPTSASLPPARLTDDQWRAQLRDERVICACPKYQFEYADKVHLKASGYDRLGEYYGKAFFQSAVLQRPFRPLHPLSASEDATGTILVQFHVPVAPLRWDELLGQEHHEQAAPWALGRGFEVRDKESGAKVVIQHVSLVEGTADVVSIRVAQRRLGGQGLVLAYAMTQDADGPACGSASGRAGLLCDSDETRSASAETLAIRATRGEARVYCETGWAHRAVWDVVRVLEAEQMGDGNEFAICAIEDEGTVAVLDRPWTGRGGRARVEVGHNLRNYCVSFEMDVQ